MAGAARQETGRAAFALEQLEATDGRLIVSGRWSGVRGMRFVRPTLVLDDRQLLATLDHKPWAPDTDPWVAAFPWDGGAVDRDRLELSVAPSVTVPLGEAAENSAPPSGPLEDQSLDRLRSEVRFLRSELDARTEQSSRLESAAAQERRTAEDATALRDDLDRTRRDAERERDSALAQLAEAVADREAAVRSRARMETQRDEAIAERTGLEAERDDALARLAELRMRVDEVILANEHLKQQQLQGRLAEYADARTIVTARAVQPPADREDGEIEEPIGVRAIPAARLAAPVLLRSRRATEIGASSFDVWAVRVLGTAAAICFIVLLVMFVRLFI